MNIRSCASVITLGIGVLRLTTFLAYASPGDGQDATPGNAMNPRAVSSIVERDPEGLGIVEGSRAPSGLLIAPTPLVKEPKKAGGMLYRTTIEFVPVGVTGDKGVAKFREYQDLDSGAYLNNFTVMIEKPASAFHFDAVGGGVARSDQYYGVDVGRYNTWRVRGSFSEIPHVFTSTYRSLWDGTGSGAFTLRGLTPGRDHRRQYDAGEHASRDFVGAGLRPRALPEAGPRTRRPHVACELESLRQLRE